ncbi:hypothetical protein KFK09_027100 [Dendrobium nobile]|uniref:Transmembrane protein n=1 Tax=Dendrobium nobile TaxID=94219 RepID=A0A8T3A9V2_DENNO|nr:hypothetical protein KFK09_027100 [Dendrobium nobile]
MADPEVDSGLVLDDEGHIHPTRSTFFDVGFGYDETVEDYLNRILPTLIDIIDERFEDYEWTIESKTSVCHPPPATFPWFKTIGVATFLVASFGVLKFLSRKA